MSEFLVRSFSRNLGNWGLVVFRLGSNGRAMSAPVGSVKLKPGKEKKLRNHYPVIHKGEGFWDAGIEPGSLVEVMTDSGEFVGIGTLNQKNRFPVRMLTLKDEAIDQEFFAKRFQALWDQRMALGFDSNAFRWVYSEADCLPGLIVDRFAEHAIVQVRTLGMERLRDAWAGALREFEDIQSAYERSDIPGRRDEGLAEITQPIFGETPEVIEIHEGRQKFAVSAKEGLKTGHFLDQRNSRQLFADRVKPGDNVLDCFCYTGGFSIAAALSGATSLGVDIHPVAIEIAKRNAELNNVEVPFIEANAFEFLEDGAGSFAPFDWIILDPPAIGKTRDTRDSLKWAIWKLVHHALPHLKVGGTVIVCACANQMSIADIADVCRVAAADQGMRLTLDDVTLQDKDHPAPLNFPEALYLKCLWLRRLN